MLKQFYCSNEWAVARKQFLNLCRLEKRPFVCKICGVDLCFATAPEKDKIGKSILNVDHILPVKKYWEKRLELDNLQLLCHDCNREKSNITGHRNVLEAIQQAKLEKEKLQARIDAKNASCSEEELRKRFKRAYKTGQIPQLIKPKPVNPEKPEVRVFKRTSKV